MRELRVWVSLAAASVGVEICLYQRHFTLDWRDPTGFGVIFQHRCGLVMVAAAGWMMVEVSRATWMAIRRPWLAVDVAHMNRR